MMKQYENWTQKNDQGLNNIVKNGKQLANRRETHLMATAMRLNDQ